MFKIIQAKLQQYMNQELSDVQDGKSRGTREQIANIHWIIKKAKWLSDKALQIAMKEGKQKKKTKEKRKDIPI